MPKTKPPAPIEGASEVFIAWGGDKSEIVAEGLADWLPKLFDTVKPWMSKKSIRSGTAWFPTVRHQLERTAFGILCLTDDNLENPWIHFEAGAIAKQVTADARVTPYLLGIGTNSLSSPFNAFQARTADEGSTYDLVTDINQATGNTVSDKILRERFADNWPRLDAVLKKAEQFKETAKAEPDLPKMVAEMLGIARSTGRDVAKLVDFLNADARSRAILNRFLDRKPGLMESMFGPNASEAGSSISSLYAAAASFNDPGDTLLANMNRSPLAQALKYDRPNKKDDSKKDRG